VAQSRGIASGTNRKSRDPAVRGRPGREAGKTARPKTSSKTSSEPAVFVLPMKALSVDAVPEGRWRLEVKLDGYRAVAVINGGEIQLWSRNRKLLTADYPEVVDALKKLRCSNATLDGEIVALDKAGRSRFQLLQGRNITGARPNVVYYVFDLLHLDGRSWIKMPIEERQAALEKLAASMPGAIRFSPVFERKPADLLAAVQKQGLEGIIAKRPGSLYEPDQRSGTWLKCKVHGEQEFVIGGFTPPRNSRPYFGAILVGYYDGDELLYAGKVGSGYNFALLKSLHGEFMKRKRADSPFANLPTSRPRFGTGMTAGEMRKVTWVKPELVCQVRFTEWTDDGMLRHPVFLGLRHDKAAREVVREAAPL
jgi:bifunctional non-homologous end joining protein LigD